MRRSVDGRIESLVDRRHARAVTAVERQCVGEAWVVECRSHGNQKFRTHRGCAKGAHDTPTLSVTQEETTVPPRRRLLEERALLRPDARHGTVCATSEAASRETASKSL